MIVMDNETKIRPIFVAKLLYELTDENHFLTTAQLSQLLEERYKIKVYRQTLKKDIELLKQAGMDIQEIKSTQNRYNIVSRLFDIPELKLLIDAVESSKFITKKKSRELVEKLGCLAGVHSGEELKRNLCVEGRVKPGNEKIYVIVDAINKAINADKKISFQYFRYNAHKEQKLKRNGEPFIFSPKNLVWNGDYYYMVGVFDYKQKIGSFRVDRIASCPVIMEEAATAEPDDFDINVYLNTTFRMYNAKRCDVELVCDNNVMDSIIDLFGTDIEAKEMDDSSFKVTVKVAVGHVFFSWVFGFGGLVKIAGPDEVKKQYADMVQSAAADLTSEQKQTENIEGNTDVV